MRNKKCDNLPRPHCHLTFTLVSLIDIYYNSYKGFLRYWGDIEMKYRVAIYNSDEGCSISVPGLPGCWSKGETEEEAIENIKIAISEYLEVVEEELQGMVVREVEVI